MSDNVRLPAEQEGRALIPSQSGRSRVAGAGPQDVGPVPGSGVSVSEAVVASGAWPGGLPPTIRRSHRGKAGRNALSAEWQAAMYATEMPEAHRNREIADDLTPALEESDALATALEAKPNPDSDDSER